MVDVDSRMVIKTGEEEWQIIILGGTTPRDTEEITLRINTQLDFFGVIEIVKSRKWIHAHLPFSPFLLIPMLSAQKEEQSVKFILTLMSECGDVTWVVPTEEHQLWMYDRIEEAYDRLCLFNEERKSQ